MASKLFVRFASVYFDFTSLDEFEEVLASRRKKKSEVRD